MSKQIAAVDLDSQLEVLRAIERRRVLRTLLLEQSDDEPPVDLEQTIPETDPPDMLSMHHVHLPKLEEKGFVQVSDDGVKKGPNFDQIRPLLRLLEENRDELPADWV